MILTVDVGTRIGGTPAPKGSLRCVSRHARGWHSNLQEDNHATAPWRGLVCRAARRITAQTGVTGIVGPIGVDITVTLPLPASVRPEKRTWPYVKGKGAGDVDKLARTILDGLQDAGLYADDAQVVELTVRKCYPHTPGVPDRLDRPGATIRIYPIGA